MMSSPDCKAGKVDFGTSVARILPLIIREFTRMQKSIFSKGLLTIPQMVILDLLAERGPCKMSELARSLDFSMSAVTAIVDKMIEMRLVKRERSREDRRVVKVIIMNKGSKMFSQVCRGRRDCANELFAGLTEKDKNEYIRILNKVHANLRRNDE